MSTLFSATLLTIGAVLLWRSEWATSRRAQKRSKPQKQYADFWTDFTPKQTGTPSWTTVMDDDDIREVGVEYCDRCPGRAVYIAYKDDGDMVLCQHHAKEQHKALKASGFGVQFLPGAREAVAPSA